MELFERIIKAYEAQKMTQAKIAEAVGASPSKFNQWLNVKSQKNLWEHLPVILKLFPNVRREWLWWGEGEMFDADNEEPASKPQQDQALSKIASVPVIGFASCSLLGWDGEMTIPMSAAAPHVSPRTIVVMANGESMIPAGIGHGHLCFCDPDLEPLRGDIVYVRRHDNLGTLKTFLGWGLEAGIAEATKGELCLRGWLDRNEFGQQKEIFLTVDKILVKTVAPVVFVRRRM